MNVPLSLLALLLAGPLLSAQGGLAGGGSLDDPANRPDCVSPEQRGAIASLVAAHRASGKGWTAAPAPYAFYPQAGTHYEDLWISNYVDLDPSSSILDWDCWSYTYNGHGGSDSLVRSFGEQLVGVPVYAAQDGVVVTTADGHPDMNIVWGGLPPNFVIIDHGDDREAYYFHLKNGSVAVSPGEVVVAGQQIGLAASSGMSSYPHLHLETVDGTSITEPFTGDCLAGPSGWVAQIPLVTTPFAWDFGFSRVDMQPYSLPTELPRSGQIAFADPLIYHWLMLPSLPPFSTWRVVYKRPDGSSALDSGTVGFGNTVHFNFSYWYWNYDIAEMHSLAGTWSLELFINGDLLVDAPVDVVAVYDPVANHVPEPITAQILPVDATFADVLHTVVSGDPVVDDRDYDIVRYHYSWTVDGAVVRDVTTAARSDTLPAQSNGGIVKCQVTPGDGIAEGALVEATLGIPGLAFSNLGMGLPGASGIPVTVAEGTLAPLSNVRIVLADAAPLAPAWLVVGFFALNAPFKGGVLVPDPTPPGFLVGLASDANGDFLLDALWPQGIQSGTSLFLQWWIQDQVGPNGFSASNALQGVTP